MAIKVRLYLYKSAIIVNEKGTWMTTTYAGNIKSISFNLSQFNVWCKTVNVKKKKKIDNVILKTKALLWRQSKAKRLSFTNFAETKKIEHHWRPCSKDGIGRSKMNSGSSNVESESK